MKKLYKVGIYCRLSLEDAANSAKAKNYIPGDESVSIENQYEILSKFVMLNGWVEAKTYRDDGYSGGNFQRPGFREMLEDARNGLINLILMMLRNGVMSICVLSMESTPSLIAM